MTSKRLSMAGLSFRFSCRADNGKRQKKALGSCIGCAPAYGGGLTSGSPAGQASKHKKRVEVLTAPVSCTAAGEQSRQKMTSERLSIAGLSFKISCKKCQQAS
jgi:hypothetical protein